MDVLSFTVVSALVAAVLLLATGLRVVPEGCAATVHRFGRYQRTLQAGLHFTWPLIERVVRRIDLGGRSLDLEFEHLPGPDGAGLAARGRVYFQIVDPVAAAPEADRSEAVVSDITASTLRRLAPELPKTPTEDFNRSLRERVNAELRSHGMMVVRCQLQLRQAA